MEKNAEAEIGRFDAAESRLEADTSDTAMTDCKTANSDSQLTSSSKDQNTEHSTAQLNRRDEEQSDKTKSDAENLTDRLVSMAVQGEKGSDEDEEAGDFLSASEGDSDDEKIQEWGDTLSEPADTFHSSAQAGTPSADNMCNTDVPDSDERQTAAAASETGAEDGDEVGDGAGEGQDSDEKDDESKRKEDEEKERKRQEMEDALTEEERQSRLAEAVKLKTSGNDAFKQSQYTDAVELYTQGLELCPLKYVQQRSIMMSNRAACHMKEENYEDAVKDCSKAIDLQPTYIKAINRRADAYEKLEKLEEALKDHQRILELDRTQANSYHACMRLEKEIKERNEKMKEEMLGKLKDLGNLVLRPFGLSTNNFQLNQDPNTGGYSVQFVQSPPNNGH